MNVITNIGSVVQRVFFSLLLMLALCMVLASCDTAQTRRRMAAIIAEADSMNRHYVPMTSDSLLLLACQYYDRHGTPNERMRARYLLGCAYRDMGEAPQALECYQDAIASADTTVTGCDFQLMMKISGQMAGLFHAQNLPHDELVCWDLYSYYAMKHGDRREQIRGIELSIRPYLLLRDTAQVIKTIKETRKQYLELGDSAMAVSSYGTLTHLLIERGQLDEARRFMEEFEGCSSLFDADGNIIAPQRIIYYYIKGEYYLKRHQLDTAEYYMRKLPEGQYRRDYYRGLLAVYREKANADSVFKYAQLYEDATDSLNDSMRTDVLHRMNTLYNYHRFQQDAAKRKEELNRVRWKFGLLTAIFLLVLASMLYFNFRLRRRKAKELAAYKKNLLLLDEKQMEIEILLKHENDNRQLIDRKEQEIQELTSQILRYEQKSCDEASELAASVQRLEEVKHFQHMASIGQQPTAQEWVSLFSKIDSVLPRLSAFLKTYRHRMNDAEYKVCYLLCMHISNKGASNLLNVSPAYVNKLRKNMLQNIFKSDGTASDFDKRLLETVGLIQVKPHKRNF